MAGKFELYKDAKGKYRFRLKAVNGEIIAVGEARNRTGTADRLKTLIPPARQVAAELAGNGVHADTVRAVRAGQAGIGSPATDRPPHTSCISQPIRW